MLFYVTSRIFPGKTFVVVCDENDTIAHAKAHMLHILYELGRSDLQFRFRFKGEYLKDALTLKDYGVSDNCVVEFAPLAKPSAAISEMRRTSIYNRRHIGGDVITALEAEVKIFKKRETLLANLRVVLWVLGVATVCAAGTVYWYSFTWQSIFFLFGILKIPSFSRLGGFVGRTGLFQRRFAAIFSVMMLLNLLASVILAFVSSYIEIVDCYIEPGQLNTTAFDEGAFGGEEIGVFYGCKHQLWYSAIYFALHALVVFMAVVYSVKLWYNFKFEIGTYIEPRLIESKNIHKLLTDAASSRSKSQRNAAFELNNLAATSQDNKFKIVSEGGVQTLISLSLSTDEATQEYAVEALAELLTIPAIQDQFVEEGGLPKLMALLHAFNSDVVNEAAVAISYIAADNEAQREAIASHHGLEDLCHAVRSGDVDIMCSVAGTFLDLSMTAASRSAMVGTPTVAAALVQLSRCQHHETQRLALQTIELLALENSNYILTDRSLLASLLSIPKNSNDTKLWLLAAKIMMYFVENSEGCRGLVHADGMVEAFVEFGSSSDEMLQVVMSKIVLSMIEAKEHRSTLVNIGFHDVLTTLRTCVSDEGAWRNVEQAIVLFGSSIDVGMSRYHSARSLDSDGGKRSVQPHHPHRVKFATPD
ncbi:uncharacterized protein LOC134182574 [Corticium candelabrum]|uniref:uncharacterized protein LOC134182574 n=1 Tax=Corticium candelabrum TaxID=121492 RepID=UPI002E26ECD1|nr:uncharacterized protein LOC134182574 [Corticium candelabrum]